MPPRDQALDSLFHVLTDNRRPDPIELEVAAELVLVAHGLVCPACRKPRTPAECGHAFHQHEGEIAPLLRLMESTITLTSRPAISDGALMLGASVVRDPIQRVMAGDPIVETAIDFGIEPSDLAMLVELVEQAAVDSMDEADRG